MARIGVGNKIEETYLKLIDELHDRLGGKKYRIYEASIDIFNALPPILQMALISNDEELRKQILDIISQMKYPPEPKKGGKKR